MKKTDIFIFYVMIIIDEAVSKNCKTLIKYISLFQNTIWQHWEEITNLILFIITSRNFSLEIILRTSVWRKRFGHKATKTEEEKVLPKKIRFLKKIITATSKELKRNKSPLPWRTLFEENRRIEITFGRLWNPKSIKLFIV